MNEFKAEIEEDLGSRNSCFVCLQQVHLNNKSEGLKLTNLFFKYLKIREEVKALVCAKCGEKLKKFVKLYSVLEKVRLEMDYVLELINKVMDSNNANPFDAGVTSARRIVMDKCLESGEKRKLQILLERLHPSKLIRGIPPATAAPDCADDYSLNFEDIINSTSDGGEIQPEVKSEPETFLEYENAANNNQMQKQKCTKCSKTFSDKINLTVHLNRVHRLGLSFKCPTCLKLFRKSVYLRNHINAVHLHIKPYKCDRCDKSFAKQNTLSIHKATPHKPKPQIPDSEKFPCKICGKSFGSLQIVRVHQRNVHSGERFPCAICNKIFRGRDTLRKHVISVHEKQRHYCQVPGCNTSYARQNRLAHHYRMNHPNFNVLRKRREGKTWKDLEKLEDGSWECKICVKKFELEIRGRAHMTMMHTSRTFLCEDCGFSSSLESKLKAHIRNVHSINSFECELCKKRFKNTTNFNTHVKKVHGPKTFLCQECGYSTTWKAHLQRHVKNVHKDRQEVGESFEENVQK